MSVTGLLCEREKFNPKFPLSVSRFGQKWLIIESRGMWSVKGMEEMASFQVS